MNRGDINTPIQLKNLSRELDFYGYYSLLLTYHSQNPDLLLKSLVSAESDIKLKYMIAMRTYAVSPEYLAMITASYNQIFPNKLMFNIVSGDLHADETTINDIVMFKNHFDTPDKRLIYTEEWISTFLRLCEKWYVPEIVMAGHSQKTKVMANKFNATHLSMLDMYLKDPRDTINKKQMVSLSLIIRDSKEEAEQVLKNSSMVGASLWTICGTESDINKEIKKLENLGVTDIIISQFEKDYNVAAIHKIVKDYE
jgi:alkanesulfonate monooxygenase SsuD/methylene tetrahydromethanopterin reductase-like flavin-dependent oxidoreductase (luciferase family)